MYCLPHRRQPRPSGAHARRNSTRRLCVLPAAQEAAAAQWRPRAQLDQEALCTAPATRKAAATQQRPRAPQLDQEARLCVLRLPHERQPRPAAAKGKAAAAQRRPRAPRLDHVLRLPHERQPRPSPRAPQLDQEALCTAPDTREAAAAQWRPRAPQPTRRLCVYCACHARGSRTAPE